MLQDEVLYKIADRVKNFAVIYLCDIDEVCFFHAFHPEEFSLTQSRFLTSTPCMNFTTLARFCSSSATST